MRELYPARDFCDQRRASMQRTRGDAYHSGVSRNTRGPFGSKVKTRMSRGAMRMARPQSSRRDGRGYAADGCQGRAVKR
jgi:hypothetical protein